MKIINGKWQCGNLYDALVAARFDRFINIQRQMPQPVKKGVNLKQYNYQFNRCGCLTNTNQALQLLQPDVIKSVCKHEYVADSNWKSLTCRLCNDRIEVARSWNITAS